MPQIENYHKPQDLESALALLDKQDVATVPLAGGTWLNPRLAENKVDAVVDLSELALDYVETDVDTLRIGATATLAAIAENPKCRELANGVLAQAALRDAPPNRRNRATAGGTLMVAPSDSELLLALCALDAEFSFTSSNMDQAAIMKVTQFLPIEEKREAISYGLITRMWVHLPFKSSGSFSRISRTPSDHPIVSSCCVITAVKDCARVAIGGLAAFPIVLQITDLTSQTDIDSAIDQQLDSLMPSITVIDDFIGSAEYRKEMAHITAKRAVAEARERME